MFQAVGRGGEAGVLAFAPAFGGVARSPLRAHAASLTEALGRADLCVDLGDRIGSREWWRGLATLTGLAACVWLGGAHLTRVPVAVRPALTPAQADDAAPDAIAPLARGATTGRVAFPTRAVEALADIPERPRVEITAPFRRTDSLEGALRRAGVGPGDASAVVALIGPAVRLDRITGDTDMDLVLGRRETKRVARPLTSLALRAAFDLRVEVSRDDDGTLVLKRVPIAVDATPLRITGEVGRGLAVSARAAGLPAGVVADAIQQLGYAIDFQHGVGRRDRYDLVVEHKRAATGETETGGLLYTALGSTELMRWDYAGKAQFFRANGEGARKGLMKTPVDGARLTSGFGMRFHPLLNYSRLHQGVDFGAASGSPIIAAAAGKVSFAGWHGGHGNYVMVAHNKSLATAYGHMSRIMVRNGQTVAQGQVLGLVGSTGLSTGPHLHYEVWLNAQPVNPMTIRFLGGTQLAGDDLARFKVAMSRLRGLPAAGAMRGREIADAGRQRSRRG